MGTDNKSTARRRDVVTREDPPYRAVADELRRQIRAGRFKPGERVPSSRQLEKDYVIANMTARSALRVLADEGLIYNVTGRGNFVSDPLPAEPSADEQTEGQPAKLHSAEYRELSKRLDELNAQIEGMRDIFQRLAAFTQPQK
ncbi:GntR family transcriptional regulator [Streptomyces yunnanensis]|uniref:GntR family transcriptional regulator n=1 Tax=Streptomyces yunnanensis TaxID=156453 RepID=A0A9X8MSG4_9ACTN|nr:GntR family transcriptional regulator [Streptomyces yunnanensis]SHL62263.1 GntR family transcriptional regulator [Streptomyces yunnanensis]